MNNDFRKFTKMLRSNGYARDRTKGDHYIYVKTGCNPISISKNANRMICKRLIKENNLKGES